MVRGKLLAELEAVTEGNRDLDCEIACLMEHKVLAEGPWMESPNPMEPDYPAIIPVPFYTTSLDAALTLVPKGWHIQITGKQGSSGWGICLTSGQLREKIGLAPTLALALCIAGLLARQAMGKPS